MRITFVLPYAGISGGIRVLAIYARTLQQRGHAVTIISTPWSAPGRRRRAWQIARRWLYSVSAIPAWQDPSHLDGVEVEHHVIASPRPVIDADVPDADVVIATWWETAQWVMDLAPQKGAKAYFVQDYGAHDGQPVHAIAETWRLPLHKITISKFLLDLIREHCDDPDIDYVPNAVDLEQFRAPPRGKQSRPTVGFLYSSAPQKGCDIVLDAINRARQQISDLAVLSYGPGGPEPHLPLPAGTRFWPYAEEEQLRNIYGACDTWLFGSRLEGFGLPILEAMACRTPVIATRAGAAPELLAKGGGVLVGIDDSHTMAKAIEDIAAMNDSRWRQMSDTAYRTASSFTWSDATDLLEAALVRAVTRRPAEPEHSLAIT
jgi:glycosyltransferase involved in cell wall biosynthesis